VDLTYVPLGVAFGIGVALFWSWATGKPFWPIRYDGRWLRNLVAGLGLYALFWFFKVPFELQLLVVIAIAVASWIWNRGRTQSADGLRVGVDSRR
jgi:hypothetical protein